MLAIGDSVSCEFTIDTNQVGPLAESDVLTNRIDVSAVDNDGTGVSGFATASRTVLGEPPSLNVLKTDNGAVIDEPGENIAYDLTITNLSVTEPLTITSIVDEVFFAPEGGSQESRGSLVISGDPVVVDTSGLIDVTLVDTDCDDLIGTTLAVNGDPADNASCTVTLTLAGNAGDSYHDVVTVVAVDDEGTPAEAENEADTPVVDVLPTISIDEGRRTPTAGSRDGRPGDVHAHDHQHQRGDGSVDDHEPLRQHVRQLLPGQHPDRGRQHRLPRTPGRCARPGCLDELHDHCDDQRPGR